MERRPRGRRGGTANENEKHARRTHDASRCKHCATGSTIRISLISHHVASGNWPLSARQVVTDLASQPATAPFFLLPPFSPLFLAPFLICAIRTALSGWE